MVAGVLVMIGSAAQGGTPAVTTVRVGQNFRNPVFLTHAPGDFDRLFIVEQSGVIKMIRDGDADGEVFLDITTAVQSGGEQGLLGLAFHPDYGSNGAFFVGYTSREETSVIARYHVSADPDVADTKEERILVIDHPGDYHNGGWLEFSPDGFLYISVGEEGTPSNAQDITDNLLGKILRIDVNGDDFPDPQRNYAIPAGNPLMGRKVNDEIWAYGLRNPWRAGFDSATGDLYVGDVGASFWEEIDFLAGGIGGANFGWPTMEGLYCGPELCTPPGMTLPIYAYSSKDNPPCAVVGGYVYRGCAIPELAGTYFFGDACSGQVWTFRYNGAVSEFQERTEELAPPGRTNLGFISSFGVDAAGEVYVCDRTGGEIYKVVPDPPPAIAMSDPPSGAIDARRPVKVNGDVVWSGWAQVTLSMNAALACVKKEQFHISQEGGIGPPASIQSVGLTQEMIDVELSHAIEAVAWTDVLHEDSGTSVRLGALPADVDGSATSNAADVTALVDSLRGAGPPRPIWSTDLDRSTRTTGADVLEAVDLLNGEGEFSPYNGVSLP